MMRFINLTPHPIVVRLDNGAERIFPPIGTIARVSSTLTPLKEINGIPVVIPLWGPVEGLPDPKDDTTYIVSSLVLSHIRDRTDMVSPDTSPNGAIRDEQGRIMAVRGFQGVV